MRPLRHDRARPGRVADERRVGDRVGVRRDRRRGARRDQSATKRSPRSATRTSGLLRRADQHHAVRVARSTRRAGRVHLAERDRRDAAAGRASYSSSMPSSGPAVQEVGDVVGGEGAATSSCRAPRTRCSIMPQHLALLALQLGRREAVPRRPLRSPRAAPRARAAIPPSGTRTLRTKVVERRGRSGPGTSDDVEEGRVRALRALAEAVGRASRSQSDLHQPAAIGADGVSTRAGCSLQ